MAQGTLLLTVTLRDGTVESGKALGAGVQETGEALGTTVAKDEATTKQMMKRYRRCQEWLKAFKNHLVDSNLLETRPEVEELLLETKKEITNRGGYCSVLRRS